MIIRGYRRIDGKIMAQLFYDTVHTINAKDYTKEQLDAWATGNIDLNVWNSSFLEHNTLIAEQHARNKGLVCFETYASITAKSFFERQGYSVEKENKVIRNGITLVNYKMFKHD